jgi:hypothetical protein
MEPINVIIWTCVIVFAITAILTILHISGIRPMPDPKHGATLFKLLIAEIVIVAVSAFGAHLSGAINIKEFIGKNGSSEISNNCDRYDNNWFSGMAFVGKLEEMKVHRCYPKNPRGRFDKGIEEFIADWEPFGPAPFAFETRLGQDEVALNADAQIFLSKGYKLENQSSFTDANGKTLYQSTWVR